jgi:hypothetical protein
MTAGAKILDEFSAVARRIGRPFSLTIDISTCPKIYFLQLLAFAIGSGIVSQAQVFYAETAYDGEPLQKSGVASGYRFTDGAWQSLPVPYLEGHFRPGRRRHAVVSIGGDSPSVDKLIRRYEPERLTLISPIPSISESIEADIRRETEAIRKSFGETDVIEVGAFDVVRAFSILSQTSPKWTDKEEVCLFCLGSKPQSLAIGLSALIDQRLPVVCRVPTRYLERAHTATGSSWLFRIRDLSAPTAQ